MVLTTHYFHAREVKMKSGTDSEGSKIRVHAAIRCAAVNPYQCPLYQIKKNPAEAGFP
jgi:hypothetical protein